MIKRVYYVAKTAVRDVDIRGAPAVGTAPVPGVENQGIRDHWQVYRLNM